MKKKKDKYVGKIEDSEVIEHVDVQIPGPTDQINSKDGNVDMAQHSDEEDSPIKPKRKGKMSQMKAGVKSLFSLSKKEEKERKEISTSTKKLPKNFANMVLDYELKIDSGNFDIEIIDKLMQLYSVS